jgi:hypothetical protein
MTEPTPLEIAIVDDDLCPRCLGELDTGWECNECGFNAYGIYTAILPELSAKEKAAMEAMPSVEECMPHWKAGEIWVNGQWVQNPRS